MPTIAIGKLRPGKNTRIFYEKIVELALVIEKSGWVAPLSIDETGEIKAGERRWRACTFLNDVARRKGEPIPWPELPYEEFEGTEKEAYLRTVAENSGRQELRFIEWAKNFQCLREQYGYSNKEIGTITGYDETTVSRYISILERSHPSIIARLENGDQIPVNILIKTHTISNKEVQLQRIEQWYGNPATETDEPKIRERKSGLSRKKIIALLRVIQDKGASPETIETVQYIAGMRQKLPHNWHLSLSRSKRRSAPE